MRRGRRTRSAACVVAMGALLSLAPLGAAGAKANPHGPVCRAVEREQAGATAAGFAIEKALASGNFAGAKRQMLRAYDAYLSNVTRPVGAFNSAPPDVRAAFKSLRTDVGQVRHEITRATSLAQLEARLQALGHDPTIQKDSTTIAQWTAAVCGTSPPQPSTGG